MMYKGIPEGIMLQVNGVKNRIRNCNVIHLNRVIDPCNNLNVSWSISSSVML